MKAKNPHPENCHCEICRRWRKLWQMFEAKAVKFPAATPVAWPTPPMVTAGHTYIFVRQWAKPAGGNTWTVMLYTPANPSHPQSYDSMYWRVSKREPEGTSFREIWPFAGLTHEIASRMLDPGSY